MYAPMKQSFAQTCVLCFHRLAGSPSDVEGGANMDEEVVVDVYDNPHANDSGPEMGNFDVEEAPEELLRQDGDLPAEEEDVEQPLPAPVVAAPGRGRARPGRTKLFCMTCMDAKNQRAMNFHAECWNAWHGLQVELVHDPAIPRAAETPGGTGGDADVEE